MQKHHYYASSVAEWRTSENIKDLTKIMDKAKFPYVLWLVPVPESAHYEIRGYEPQVPGAVAIWASPELKVDIAQQFAR